MARAVTIDEFKEWVEKNKHRTWFHELKDGSINLPTMEIKYFYPNLDTRDMMIFFIKTNREDVYGSHNDTHDTVLTALEARLNGEKVEEFSWL